MQPEASTDCSAWLFVKTANTCAGGRPGAADLYLTALAALDYVAPTLGGFLVETPPPSEDLPGISSRFLTSLEQQNYSNKTLFSAQVRCNLRAEIQPSASVEAYT